MEGLIGVATAEKAGLVSANMFSFSRGAKDANNCLILGNYRLDPNTLNVPDGITYGDVLFVIPWDPNTVHQFIYTVKGHRYTRIGGNTSWGGMAIIGTK